MKTKNFSLLAGLAGLLAVSAANAAINIDTVLVGDAGNPNDFTGFYYLGQVNYNYHIGTYEVTNAQYTSFLNATAATDTHGLYNTNMAGYYGGITRSGSSDNYSYSTVVGRENNPVNFVSFWDAARFTNWLTTGNTETGVYNLGGVTNPVNDTITRDETAWANGGVAIASENEWYKAAYYSGSPTGADGDGYWLYPTQNNSITTADANYLRSVNFLTEVGTYAVGSYYGTFDQGGNVGEWSDEISANPEKRNIRGGGLDSNVNRLQSLVSGSIDPTPEGHNLGFRVSSLEPIESTIVPEPSTYAAIFGGLGLLIALLRRNGRSTL